MSETFDRIREWMDTPGGRWTMALVALGAITLAILIWVLGPDQTDTERARLRGVGRQVTYYCKACKSTGKAKVPVNKDDPSQGVKSPFKCPKCGEQQAVLGLKCVKCKEVFEKPPSETKVFRCPHCGRRYDLRMPGGGERRRGPGPGP